MAKMMMANKTSNAIWSNGAIAFKIENSTTWRPKKKEESIQTVKFNISKFSMVQFNFDKSQNSTLKLCAQSKHTLHI